MKVLTITSMALLFLVSAIACGVPGDAQGTSLVTQAVEGNHLEGKAGCSRAHTIECADAEESMECYTFGDTPACVRKSWLKDKPSDWRLVFSKSLDMHILIPPKHSH